MSELGDRIKVYRAQHKTSRRAFAEATGLTQTKVYNLENGRAATPDELKRVMEFLAGARVELDATPLPRPVEPATPAAPAVEPPAEHPAPAVVDVPSPRLEETLQEDLTPDDRRPIVELEPGVRYVSNSEIQTFKDCRRKWWLTWHRHLRPTRFGSVSLVGAAASGSRVHRALAAYYVPDGTPREDPRDALERALIEDWTTWTSDLPDWGLDDEQDTIGAFKNAAETERAMIEGYTEWLAETGADADYRVIAPEQFVTAPLELDDALAVRLVGQLDVRLLRERDGATLFMDHKSVGDFTRPTRTLQLDEQMLHYTLLERKTSTPDQPRTTGALYNMLRRVKRTVRANPPFFKRVEVTHNDLEIGSFHRRLKGTVNDILDVERRLADEPHPERVVYPRPTQDCAWKCPFFQVCSMFDDGSRVEDALAELYTVGEPLDYYKSIQIKTGEE